MPHPLGVSSNQIKSPLPGFSAGAQKIIEKAIEKNDLEFFYSLYLSRLVELSLTGRGKDFYDYAKTATDETPAGPLMARGFEALSCLIDLDFKKCLFLLDELEEATNNLEINLWVQQISNLCRAHISFHSGDFKSSINYGYAAINSPIKSGSLDPIDEGRLLRLICCIYLITGDLPGINKCAEEIAKVADPQSLADLRNTKSAIKSMQLLIEGDFKKAYDLAQTVIHIESALGRKGIASPYDCKFVMLRCQFELGLLEQAESLIAEFREEVVHNKFDSLLFLCEASLIRIMARDVNRLPDAFKKVEHLQDLLAKNPNFSEMSWLVDMCELFVRVSSKDIARAKVLLDRNQHIPYVQLLNSSKLRFITEEELQTVQALPENTPFEIMNKYISLAKFQIIGSKKQEKFLEVALKVGEKSGAKEIFLRQPNSVLESIIKIANGSSSQWLESLSRSAIARIKEREGQASFGGEQLTKREIEILKYLASGKSIEEIGSALHISKNTMKTHLKNVYRKLKVKDRKEASELAKNKLLV